MRFSTRDLLWLTLVVAMGTVWGTDRWRQDKKINALREVAGLEMRGIFPRNWEGRMAAFHLQNDILKYRVDELRFQLQSRGHQVEIDDCGHVVVDRPLLKPIMPAIQPHAFSN